jgi:hypothetical protein
VVDCIDDVIVLRKMKLIDATARDQIIDGNAVAFWIYRQNTFAQYLDLGTIDAAVQRVNLAICVTDVNVVVIDERDVTDARTRASLGCPGSNTTDTDDAKLCALQRIERCNTENPTEAFESLQVLGAWH